MKFVLHTLAAGALVASVATAQAESKVGTDFEMYGSCQKIVAHRLQEFGLELDQLSDISWEVNYDGRVSDDEISDIHFQGTPPGCSDGHLTIKMHDTDPCSIVDYYTTGSCQVKGIKQAWW